MIEDKYTRMVKTAMFNPFNITCEPSLQNAQQLPDLRNVFKKELNDLCFQIGTQDNTIQKDIVLGYTFNLVESYYNNAGYVPMNSLNQIIEQVFETMQQTGFKNVFSSLDDFKYRCYCGYLNQ